MATQMIVIRPPRPGKPSGNTTPMDQATAKTYLGNLVGDGSRLTNLSQALNQAFNGQGKANGVSLMYDGKQTKHASAGVAGVSSVTLFYYESGMILYLFAMGQHKGGSSYTIVDFGPPTGSFKAGGTVAL